MHGYLQPSLTGVLLLLPLLRTVNLLLVGNLSAHDSFVLETWGNSHVVGVNQDPEGHAAINLGLKELHSRPTIGTMAPAGRAVVAECGGEPELQRWTYGSPAPQFFVNNATQQCLNVNDCKTEVQYDQCTTKAATCGGRSAHPSGS